MLTLKNKNITFPAFYDGIKRKKAKVGDIGWTKIGNYTLRHKIDIAPQEGFQEDFIQCGANIIFLCGESQVGKSYAMHLKATQGVGLDGYTAIFISGMQQDMKKGSSVARDAVDVIGGMAGCEYTLGDPPTFTFPKYNNSYQLLHSNFATLTVAGAWELFTEYAKKKQASYIAIDEATALLDYRMFMYWLRSNRDSSGMTPQLVASFNPVHEHYTTRILKYGGYLGDDWYLKKEMMGVIRYFYNKGEDPSEWIWGDTVDEVAELAGIKLSKQEIEAGVTNREAVKSFTVFTGETADNRILLHATKGQNIGNLHNLGGKQRQVMKEAYFGPIEDENLSVNTDMIHSIFSNPIDSDETMYATLDVSEGKDNSDGCPMVIWRGLTIIAIEMCKANPKDLVDWINIQLNKYNVPIENFAFDATGIGTYLKYFSNGVPYTANKRQIQEMDSYGNPVLMEQYTYLRSQVLEKVKTMIEKGEISCSLDKYYKIPYGKSNTLTSIVDILSKEKDIFIKTEVNKRIHYKSKDEFKLKYKYSPDLMDSISLIAMFFFDARQKKKAAPIYNEDNYHIGANRGWNNTQTRIYLD